jgi:UDP-GlcNAc:undecaprenyl-phosphate GlcNAc-1-phosphate transferase
VTFYFGFIIAVFVTMVLIPPLTRLAARMQIVDVPDARKVHTGAIPRVGGIAMAVGALLPMVLWVNPGTHFIGYLSGALIILVFGVWDDRRDLDYRLKFLGQIAAVLIVVLYGGVVIRYVPFLGIEPVSDVIAIPLTIFALLGITNAINLADGLDGLAGGTTMLSLGIIAIMAYMADGIGLVLMTVSVMGGILGFLRYNTHPARIFMGDAGSQFLGFSAGVFAILLTQRVSPALSPAVAIMLLGLPIFDTLMVMSQRIYEGRSPFSPDKNHIHHKLLAIGLSHYDAVVAIYLLQSSLVLGAYFLRFQSDWVIVATYAAVCVALALYLRQATRASGIRVNVGPVANSKLTRAIAWLREDQRLLKASFLFAFCAISAYLMAAAIFVERVPLDIGLSALVLLVLMLALAFIHRGKPFGFADRGVAYVTAAFTVYLVQTAPGPLANLGYLPTMLFVLLAVAVAIAFRFSQDRFRVTPLDFLVIFVAIVVPSLPDPQFRDTAVGDGVVKLLVLFYGLELVLENMGQHVDIMRWVTCTSLGVIAARAAF